jgi:hypothetical protein
MAGDASPDVFSIPQGRVLEEDMTICARGPLGQVVMALGTPALGQFRRRFGRVEDREVHLDPLLPVTPGGEVLQMRSVREGDGLLHRDLDGPIGTSAQRDEQTQERRQQRAKPSPTTSAGCR